LDWADIIIMNAAVADFRPESYTDEKLKKDKEQPIVKLERNPDILKAIGEKKRKDQTVIGFAAESSNLVENAVDKLIRKNLDYIIANRLNVFSRETHTGLIIDRDRNLTEIPEMDKESSAFYILEKIFKR
ncbi:phosphopantothenoylcysteine decarboxylase domain-containing protein, partial [Persephonella sp.]